MVYRKRSSDPELKTYVNRKSKYVYDNKAADVDTARRNSYTVSGSDVFRDVYLGTDVSNYNRKYSRKYSTALKTLKPFRPSSKDGTIPVNSSGFFSYLFVTWISPLVWKIYKNRLKGIGEEDIWQCSEWETSNVNTERMKKCWNEELAKRGPEKSSMLRVWLQFTRTRLAILLFGVAINAVVTFLMEGYMLQLFVSYVESTDSDLYYALSLVVITFVGQIARASSFAFIITFGAQTGVRFRAGVLGLVFDKLLRLKSLKGKSMAEIVTVFGADSLRVYINCVTFVYLLAVPMYLFISTVYIYYLIGPWCFIAVGVFFLLYQCQGVLMRAVTKLRRKTLVFTDKRIRKTTEILNSMKLIKMYAWEDPFRKAVEAIRSQEKKYLLFTAMTDSICEALIPVAPTVATVVILTPYYLVNQELKASTAFAIVATLNYMKIILSFSPFASKTLAECRISFERIKKVMLKEEYEPPSAKCLDERNAIEIDGATFRWDNSQEESDSKSTKKNKSTDKPTENNDSATTQELAGINLQVKKGSIVGICGQVGCGKSSLISAILGRMPLLTGHLAVSGTVAYAAQQAWIFPGTLRENILFGKPYDCDWYAKVIKTCGLEPDLEVMANGDETEIGDRGINLSGGQKQRVSLARAVYSDSDIYLLDDPLSAVDVHVGGLLFHKCIKKLLKKKTVFLVTHQLQYLKHCNDIIVMDDGVITEQGNHSSLMVLGGYYNSMMAKFNFTKNEASNIENVKQSVAKNDPDNDQGANKTKTENDNSEKSKFKEGQFSDDSPESKTKGKLTDVEAAQAKRVSKSAYSFYLTALGGVLRVVFMILVFTVAMGSSVFSDYWLSIWLNKINAPGNVIVSNTSYTSLNVTTEQSPMNTSRLDNAEVDTPFDVYMIVYCSSVAAILLFTLCKGIVGAAMLVGAAGKLHNIAFEKVLRAPMQFFDSNPPGRIINRFSRDLDEVDVFIPKAVDMFLQIMITILLSVAVTIINLPWVLIAILPIIVVFYLISRLSSVTIRQVRRLENVARTPLLGNLNTTGQGLFTIVSYGQQEEFNEKCLRYTDVTTTMLFLFEGIQRWVGLRLDLMACLVNVVTCLVLVLTKGSISPALAGLSLSLTVRNVSVMQFLIRISNEIEARFTSVERIHEYAKDIEIETDNISCTPDQNWPKDGNLQFSNVVMKYRENMDPVLRNIWFDVRGKEKIGIVGRTGAGKSSLAAALFRLCDLSDGQILIDGINVADITRQHLRSKISTIPQDPVLFAGTLKYNLDPFNLYSDPELWHALEQVKMKEKVKAFDAQLDYLVEENGENFSVGERQLICLARAILRKNKILILDEATASIDTETDAMIQETIRESFADCTVLTIAHRLNTVLHCDRIFILDNGQVLEAGSPQDLLTSPDSLFKAMIAAQTVKTPTTSSPLP